MPSFLLKPFVAPLAIGVAILSLLGNAFLGLNLWAEKRLTTKQGEQIEKLAGNLTTCRANNAKLEGAVAGQNIAIDGLKIAADLAAANAKLGQAAQEATAAAHLANAKALDKLPPLPAGADRCAAASALIRSTLAGERSK